MLKIYKQSTNNELTLIGEATNEIAIDQILQIYPESQQIELQSDTGCTSIIWQRQVPQ